MEARSPLISAIRGAQSSFPGPTEGTVGLCRAAEMLADGRGHKGLIAARGILESAGAFGEVTIVGEQEDHGHWTAAPLSRDDYYDFEFVWQDERVLSGTPAWGAFLVKAVPAKPAGQIGYLPVYRRLVIRESDLEKLTPRLSDWFSASQDERARLAVTWWAKAPPCPPIAEPFPLPWWGQCLEIVKCIAECQGVSGLEALQVLGTALQEIRRTSGTDDRKCLGAIHFMNGTDAELSRLEYRVRTSLRTELDQSSEARLRVLKLFDPDITDVTAATAAIVDAAYSATAPLQADDAVGPKIQRQVAAGSAKRVIATQTTEELEPKKTGPKTPAELAQAVRRALPRTTTWQTFCDNVRERCDGWADRKLRKLKPGYSDKTIERLAKRINAEGNPTN
jgi:hypothetical protein